MANNAGAAFYPQTPNVPKAMKKLILAIGALMAAIVLASCDDDSGQQSPSPTTPPIDAPEGYTLVWSDEFESPTLDPLNWQCETGGNGWGNQEKQYYTDGDNIRIEDGCLVIEARKQTVGNNAYTSGRITSKGLYEFTYGYVEARISLPSGAGTWPAFWMLGANNSTARWPLCGEIDIMEHVGSEPTMISHAAHTKEKNGSVGNNWSNRQYVDGIEEGFHTFALEWKKEADQGDDCLTFYIDGVESATLWEPHGAASTTVKWPFNKSFFIVLNLALGGSWGGAIDDSIFDNPVEMKVDYVRLFKKL